MQHADPGWPSSGVESRESKLTFKRNIVYVDAKHPPDTPLDPPYTDSFFPVFESEYMGNSSFQDNLYFNVSGDITDTFPSWVPEQSWKYTNTNRSFSEWQKSGQDQRSIIDHDPLFVDVQQLDFTLQPTSPAFSLGFKPIDVSSAGSRYPHDWRRRCVDSSGVPFDSCAAPPIPVNGYIKQGTDFRCGSSVSYMCRPGSTLYGPAIRTCTSSGWSGGLVQCIPDHHLTTSSKTA